MEKAEQNLVDPAHKKNFDFIDSIRCLAMMGIVMEHSVFNGVFIYKGFPAEHILYMSLIQLPKFGTAAFFILAGFLLGSKFVDYTPGEYFKRRLASTITPWIIWSLLFVFTMSCRQWIIQHRDDDFSLLRMVAQSFETVYLYTNYWFIINFLICIGVLLLFKKHLYSVWLGSVLLLITLTYSVNIYFEWFQPMHTTAIFGFVFFLWLGAQFNKHWEKVKQWLVKTPYWLLISLVAITFIICDYEIISLFKLKSVDPYNTLRISNIIYSMAVIMLLLKIENINFTKFFKPRETTYGIYLVHYILVYGFLAEIFRPFHLLETQSLSIGVLFLISIIRFLIIYSISFLLVTAINKTKFKWIIGR